MSKLAFRALWLQVLLLPCEMFLYMPERVDFPEIGTLGRLAGLVALPLGILEVMRRGRLRPIGRLHVSVGLFVLWSWLTIFWSYEPEATYDRAWTYLQLAVLAWLIWELAPTAERQRSLLQAYVLGACIAILDTIGNFLTGAVVSTGRFAATGFGPNDLGFTLVLAIPMAWYLSLVATRPLIRWLNVLYLPFCTLGVLLTASRGALISAIFALLIVPMTFSRQSRPVRWGFVLVLLLSAGVIYRFVPQSSWIRLASAREEFETGSFNERDRIWRAGLQVFEDHPAVGVGAGVFGVMVQPILGAPRAAHQTFLSVLVGQGLIGLTLFVGIFVVLFAPVRRLGPKERALWWVMLLTLAIGLQPRTWDYRKPIWFLFGLLAAQTSLAVAPRATGVRGPGAGPRPRPWGDDEAGELVGGSRESGTVLWVIGRKADPEGPWGESKRRPA